MLLSLQLTSDRVRGTPERFHKEMRPHEKLFERHHYHAAGYNPVQLDSPYRADSHQDIESMSFDDGEFDVIICLEVLEHCKDPDRAAREIFRVLKKSGKAIITTPFMYGYHGKGSIDQSHGSYPDFWRFTHEGLTQLFKEFSSCTIYPVHGPLETRLGMLGLYSLTNLPLIRQLIDTYDNPNVKKLCSRFLVRLIK